MTGPIEHVYKKDPDGRTVIHVYSMSATVPDGPIRLYGPQKFEGACLDSGAEQSVVGTNQAKAYTAITGRRIKTEGDALTFRFGYGERPSKGVILVRIPLPNDQHLAVKVHVVDAEIHLLIGMEVLWKESLILDFGDGVIRQKGG